MSDQPKDISKGEQAKRLLMLQISPGHPPPVSQILGTEYSRTLVDDERLQFIYRGLLMEEFGLCEGDIEKLERGEFDWEKYFEQRDRR
jgi:hypothetical protein